MTDLQGKVAIVTGGGTGIGAAAAELLGKRGASVVVSGRNLSPLQDTAQRIRTSGAKAEAIVCDIGEEAQVAALAARTMERFGRIDILHANAALTDPKSMSGDGMIADMDVALWDRVMAINLRGPMLCAKHVIPHMLTAGGGSIVFTSSGKGIQGDVEFPAYGTSKAGLNHLCRYIAAQYGKQRIRANVVVVGLVMSDALRANMPAPIVKMIEEHHLTPYLGETAHVAEAVAFLASGAAAFITGAMIPVDGGVTSHSALYADFRRMHAAKT
jgi:NAD(P)-dependent dehydrogenase (short-subunit alcohol dehydrogenase family)